MSDRQQPLFTDVKRSRRDSGIIIRDKSSIHEDGTRSFPETGIIKTRLPVIKTNVGKLNIEYVKPARAGVILYTVVEGTTLFGLGLDSKTHDLTDFAGRVIYKYDGNVINGAMREFHEETLDIFNEVSNEELKTCPVLYDENNLIIFIHIDINPEIVCRKFNNRYQEEVMEKNEPEVCGITWLSWEDFQRSIQNKGNMFYRVRRFLNRAGDFGYLL